LADALLRYIEDQLAKGFKPDIIKTRLVRQGYSPTLVEGMIESVSMTKSAGMPVQIGVNHEKSVFSKLIILLLTVGVLVAGVFFFAPGLTKEKQPLLDVQATADKFSYAPGEEAGFDLEITNMGSAARFDITLIYRILDKNDNSVISKEETVAISTSTSYHKSVTLPTSIKPGNYVLKVFANYGGKVATTSFSFEVAESTGVVTVQPSCDDGIKNQNELGIDCGGKCGGYWYDGSCHSGPKTSNGATTTKPGCADKIKNQDETEIDCGGVCGGYWYDGGCHASSKPASIQTLTPTFASIMMDARTTAKTNPEEAKNICIGLEKIDEKDKCLKLVGQITLKQEYCELIENPDYRDECYYPFFMQGDYSVCEKLTDPQSKKACEQMRELSDVRSQIVEAQQPQPEQIQEIPTSI